MNQKCLKSLLLLAVYCLSNLQPTRAFESSETHQWEHPCSVEKSKADPMLNQIKDLLRTLNPGDQFLQRNNHFPAIGVPFGFFGRCTNNRIAKIQKDLTEVAGRVKKVAVAQSGLPLAGHLNWNWKTLQLVHDLQALHVYDASSRVFYPLAPLAHHLNHALNTALIFAPTFSTSTTRRATTTTTTVQPDTRQPQYCTGKITTPEVERNRISRLMKQQTAFLLNALESQMRLYAKSVPNLKILSRTSKKTSEESRIDSSSLTSPPECHINTTVFDEWNDAFSLIIKKIHLPSEPSTCVASLKVAHSAVLFIQSKSEAPSFWHESCEEYVRLTLMGRYLNRLVDQFSEELTQLYKTHWQSILTEVINLETNVGCLGPRRTGSGYCGGSGSGSIHRYVPHVDGVDETLYSYVDELEYE